MESRIMESRTIEKSVQGDTEQLVRTGKIWTVKETDMGKDCALNRTDGRSKSDRRNRKEGQLVQKYQTAHWEEAVRHVFLSFRKCWFIWTDLDSFLLFWGNEVLTEIGGVLEFYGKENAVRRQWEREEKEEKKENLEGKQRNSKNRTALDTQKEETMDWNTAFAVLRKFYEEKWDYLNGCPRNEKAWDEEGELQCKIYVSKKRGLDRDQRMEVLKLYETMEDRKVREAVRVICG